MKIAVLCSGNGSNLQAIIDAVRSGAIKAGIGVVVADQAGAFALTRARDAGIETIVLDPKPFPTRTAYDGRLVAILRERAIDLVVLAGFMRFLSASFVRAYAGRILNIHPALLPAFKGSRAVRDTLDFGAKVTGVTVHFVDEKLDNGPIILQKCVEVREGDTEAVLLERIHRVEHSLYPEAIRLFVEGKLKIDGRRVRIT